MLELSEVRRLWEKPMQLRLARLKDLWPVLMFQGWIAGGVS
jgi:hypothetical protein